MCRFNLAVVTFRVFHRREEMKRKSDGSPGELVVVEHLFFFFMLRTMRTYTNARVQNTRLINQRSRTKELFLYVSILYHTSYVYICIYIRTNMFICFPLRAGLLMDSLFSRILFYKLKIRHEGC